MKYYDKRIYKKQEEIKQITLVLIVFIVGFAIGCYAMNIDNQKIIKQQDLTIKEKEVEIDSLKESLYIKEKYGK